MVESENSIDLFELASKLWLGRRLIIKMAILSFILGISVALLKKNEFLASAKFVPQASGEKAPSSLGGLAALAGINLSSLGAGNDIPPSLYPSIVSSIPFRMDLLNSEVKWKGNNTNYREYLEQIEPSPLFYIGKYSIGLPGLIIKAIKGEEKGDESIKRGEVSSEEIRVLTKEENELIKSLDDIIRVDINQEDGFVLISASDERPEIAAQVTNNAEHILQKYVIDYKIKQSEILLEFTTNQYELIKMDLYSLQDRLAQFKEQNQNLSSVFKQNELLRLETEYSMVNSVYGELAMQKAQAELQVQKDTPVFSVISPVNVPNEKNGPNRPLIVLLFTLLGTIGAIGLVLIKEPLNQIKARIVNQAHEEN